VLGAGLAGLNAALTLEDAGFNARVLEGSTRIGGRLYTATESEVPGYPELGGSGIGGHYARVIYAAERFGIELEPSRPRTEPREGELMYHVRGSGILPDEWSEHPLNPLRSAELRKLPLHVFQFLVAGDDNPLPKGDLAAWQSGKYAAHDVSVAAYLRSKGVSQQAIRLCAGTNMSYGNSPHDLSMLMGYQSSNLIRSLYTPESGIPRVSLAGAGGNQRIPEAMARGMASDVLVSQEVRAIRSTEAGVTVTTTRGDEFHAKYCICTFPFSALKHVQVDPYLEGKQALAVNRLAYTPVFQAHFVPTREFWNDDELPPSMWTDRSPGRFMALKNDVSDPDKVTSYVAFVNGTMAQYLDKLTAESAVQRILSDLADIRPSTRGALKHVKSWSWNRSPFAGGAYAYWQPGQITDFSAAMRKPWHRLHFAGEHTAVLSRGMEGAMESGERAAFEVLEHLA